MSDKPLTSADVIGVINDMTWCIEALESHGFKIMAQDATPEMVKAGAAVWDEWQRSDSYDVEDMIRRVFAAMWDANSGERTDEA